jgi:hypothetical protein
VLKQEWLLLAQQRIRNILNVRRFASLRQLEKKISEQGPSHKRPQPTYVFAGLKALMANGAVESEQVGHNLPTFYMPRTFGSDSDLERRDYVLDLYRKFQTFYYDPDLCGKALEKVVDRAANLGQKHHVLGPITPSQTFNGVKIKHEIDHLLFPKGYTGPQILVEDKNMREWLNPSSSEIWSVIGNALRFQNTIPVIICRKMSFLAFRVFKEIGVLCWQVYDQYFDPSIEADLAPIIHKDGLGFSDITTVLEPSEALVRFFSSVIPDNSASSAIQFEKHRDLLRRYAIDSRLDGSKSSKKKEINQAKRSALYNQFLRDLRAQKTLVEEDLEEEEIDEQKDATSQDEY